MSLEGFKICYDEGGGGVPHSDKVAKTDQALAATEEERFNLSRLHLKGKLAKRRLRERLAGEEEKYQGDRVVQGVNSD